MLHRATKAFIVGSTSLIGGLWRAATSQTPNYDDQVIRDNNYYWKISSINFDMRLTEALDHSMNRRALVDDWYGCSETIQLSFCQNELLEKRPPITDKRILSARERQLYQVWVTNGLVLNVEVNRGAISDSVWLYFWTKMALTTCVRCDKRVTWDALEVAKGIKKRV